MTTCLLDRTRTGILLYLLLFCLAGATPALALGSKFSQEPAAAAVPAAPAQGRTTTTLTFAPEALTLTWMLGQDPDLSVEILNGGTDAATITEVMATLRDAATGRQFEAPVEILSPKPGAIAAGLSAPLKFVAPSPPFAGTYAGWLTIRYNGGRRAMVPLTVITPGPTPRSQHWVPLLLCAIIVAGGSWLGFAVESWFGSGGGLERAENTVSLAETERALVESFRQLRILERAAADAGKALVLPATEHHLERTMALAREARLSAVPGPELAAVLAEAKAGQLAAAALLTELGAWKRIDADALTNAGKVIDALPWPNDEPTLKAYRTSVQNAVDAALRVDRDLKQRDPSAKARDRGAQRTIASQLRRIKGMLLLHRMTLGIVVVMSAYVTFYAPRPAFGLATDYVALFLWGLGLTQAGAQIVARARTAAA